MNVKKKKSTVNLLGFKLSVDYHQCPVGCSHDGGGWRRRLHPGLLRGGWEFGPTVLRRTSAPFSQKMKHTPLLVPCRLFAPALLRGFPWTTSRSNQSILKESNSEYSFADAKAPIFWLPDMKSQHIGKDPDAGKD